MVYCGLLQYENKFKQGERTKSALANREGTATSLCITSRFLFGDGPLHKSSSNTSVKDYNISIQEKEETTTKTAAATTTVTTTTTTTRMAAMMPEAGARLHL